MLKTLLSNWKWYAAGFLLVLWSVGVWNISARITENSYLQLQLNQANAFITANTQNEALRADISKTLTEALAKYSTDNKQNIKDIYDGLAKDPRYKSCLVTDSVRNALQRQLDSQAK